MLCWTLRFRSTPKNNTAFVCFEYSLRGVICFNFQFYLVPKLWCKNPRKVCFTRCRAQCVLAVIVFTYDQLARCQLIIFFTYKSYDQLACCQLYYSSVFTVHVKYLCVFHSFDVKLQPCAYIGVFFYYRGEGGAGGGGESSKQVITITIMLIRASCLRLVWTQN
jgi:hypothetical protein